MLLPVPAMAEADAHTRYKSAGCRWARAHHSSDKSVVNDDCYSYGLVSWQGRQTNFYYTRLSGSGPSIRMNKQTMVSGQL